jgi:RNA polymerase sigma factor (sigma-70 family)
MLSDPAHQPSGAPTAGGSMTTTPPRVRIAPACSAAGTASPRFSSHGQPDARVVDDNALTQPHPTRPDQQPTPGCQCTGGATIDCPPSTARQPGCAGDGGPTPAATTSSTETAVALMKPTPTPYADPDALPELVALALQGNQRAWQDLVHRYSPLVSSVIRRYRMNDSDADDVRQNLWMRLVEHLKDIREPRALPGWVMTTTRNEAIRVLAGKRRTEPVDPQQDDRLDNIEHTEPDADLIRAEHRAAVHAGLRELRPEHRELIELTFADTPISYQQISTRLGIPIGSIGPTRARCLKKLERTAAIRALAS